MARNRRNKPASSTSTTTASEGEEVLPDFEEAHEEVTEVTTTSTTQGENNVSDVDFDNIDELDADLIAELLADTRSRGEYGEYLGRFIGSGKVGIEVDFSDPLMVGKDATKAKTGFENAKKATVKDSDPPQLKVAGANNVKVVKKNKGTKDNPDFHLFLINTAVVKEQAAA